MRKPSGVLKGFYLQGKAYLITIVDDLHDILCVIIFPVQTAQDCFQSGTGM